MFESRQLDHTIFGGYHDSYVRVTYQEAFLHSKILLN